MTDEPKGEGKAPELTAEDAEELVRIFGLVFANSDLYGRDHGVTRKSTEDCFSVLEFLLDRSGDLTFSLADDGMMVNGTGVEQKNPLMKAVSERMKDLEISTFTLLKGLIREHFEKLVSVMNTKGETLRDQGGFAGAVAAAGIEHVKTRQVTYRAVTEDEVVVNKDIMDEGEGAATSVRELVDFLGAAVGTSPAGPGQDGDPDAATLGRPAAALQKLSDEAPDELGDVILQAVAAGGATSAGGEGAHDAQVQKDTMGMMVSCLRRVYDVLSKNPIMKTQKGKRNLVRTLVSIEKRILSQMEAEAERTGEDVSGKAQAISEAVEGLRDEVEIDGLAGEYMKKRQAIDANERRILRFIRSRGLEKVGESELRERLAESGLTVSDWYDLLHKSGVGRESASKAGIAAVGGAADAHLAILLTHMEKVMSSPPPVDGGPPPVSPELMGAVTAVEDEIRDLVLRTEQKIDDLAKIINEDEQQEKIDDSATLPVYGAVRKSLMTKRDMLILLAEIVQELCQPLAVIGCSIDMIKSKHLGSVTDPQMDMLTLAAESGERVKLLVNRLLDISGLPKQLAPDTTVQASLYSR